MRLHLFVTILTINLMVFAATIEGAHTLPTVEPVTQTERTFFGADKRDDPAIWIHPTDSSKSMVIGTDKKKAGGGLHVYDLDGNEIQYLEGGRLNNVDIIPDFFLDGDLVLASERNQGTVMFYKIDKKGDFSALESSIQIEGEPYGICGGTNSESGNHYIFVTTKAGPVEQWKIEFQSPNIILGTKVRRIPRQTQCEGCVVDKAGEYVFIGEEDNGVYQYYINPRTDNKHMLVDLVGKRLTADVEGITLYEDGIHQYLIVSSQGDSTYAVYDPTQKPGKRYLGSFKVDGATETDGIAVTSTPLGSKYPKGLLVVHNHKYSNFLFVPWERVAKALNLPLN